MRKIISTLMLLLTVAFLSFGQDIKPISPLFKNLQSPSFSFMVGGNPWIYKGSQFNPNPWTELAGWTNVKDTLTNYWSKIEITPSDTARWGTGGTDISGKEDKVNKENTTVDNSTTKYPTVNLLKTYADTKDPSSTNELNTSVSFNTSTNDLSVIDAGGTKTANIAVNANLLINGYSGTINVTTNPVVFNWPVAYSDTNYYLDIFPHYTETINGKSVLIRNAVYDFTKTTTGFSLKLDTLAGIVEYRASRTINSETPANVLLQSDLTTTVGTPGSDTKIPTEKATRTAIDGSTSNSTNWNMAYTDRLKWDGGSTGLTAANGRTSLGATTIGSNLFMLTNPSSITFPRFNADNTVSALNASDFKTELGITTTATSLDLTTSLPSNQSYLGITESGTVGENVVFGDVLYLKFSDGKWWKAKADSYATTPAMRMALASITANNSGTILIEGNVRYDSWSFAANKVYLSAATAGAATTTQPSTTGNQIQVLGIAKTSTKLYFKPSQDVGEK